MFGGETGSHILRSWGARGVCDGELGAEGGRRSIVQGQSVFFSDFLGIITKYSPRNLDYRNALTLCWNILNPQMYFDETRRQKLVKRWHYGNAAQRWTHPTPPPQATPHPSPHVTLLLHYHITQVNTIMLHIFWYIKIGHNSPKIEYLLKNLFPE